jgi:thiosulfate dehydrogenase [quinone] large subunit
MIGLAAISLSALVLFELTSISSSQPQVTTSSPGNSPSNIASNSGTGTGRLIANASNVPLGQSMTFNDPSLGPLVLIHLDNGQFVAFSSICTHAGCQVQFDPSAQNLVCPCHGAVYDPSNNAQVLGGPAPYPLQKIPIQYNPSSGNIYLTS